MRGELWGGLHREERRLVAYTRSEVAVRQPAEVAMAEGTVAGVVVARARRAVGQPQAGEGMPAAPPSRGRRTTWQMGPT